MVKLPILPPKAILLILLFPIIPRLVNNRIRRIAFGGRMRRMQVF